MSKPEWGIKRICPKCNMKYYDFNRSPIICPCPEGFEFDPDLLLKSRKGRGLVSKSDPNIENTQMVQSEEVENNLEDLPGNDILEIDDVDEDPSNLKQKIENEVEDEIETSDDNLGFIENDLDNNDDQISIEINDDNSKE